MIAWLSGWLKDIVLILLFAVFIDLLIPNNALQRYVKVVISLIILLTILSPVISLLKAESEVREAIISAESPAVSDITPLASILEKGGQLKEEADAHSAELVRAQLEGMIRDKLIADYPIDQADVHVVLGADPQTGQARIARVSIRLTDRAQSLAGSDQLQSTSQPQAGKVKPVSIEKIEQVRVTSSQASEANLEMPVKESSGLSTEQYNERDAMESQIKLSMRDWLLVEGKYIEVHWAQGLNEEETRERIGRRQS